MITSAIIAATTGIGTAIGQGVSNRKARERENKAKVEQATFGINNINKLLKENRINFNQWIDRFTSLMNTQSSDVRSIMQNALASGMANITDQTTATLNQIDFDISEARRNATDQERKVLDATQERINELKKEMRFNNREIKNSFTQQGINGGALAAAMSRNLNNLNEAVVKIDKLSADQVSDIRDRLSATDRAGLFQRAQTGLQSTIQRRQLGTDIATSQASQLSNLALQGEQIRSQREQGFQANQQDLIGEAIKLGAVGGSSKLPQVDIAGAL